jgi:hypothetical protein
MWSVVDEMHLPLFADGSRDLYGFYDLLVIVDDLLG